MDDELDDWEPLDGCDEELPTLVCPECGRFRAASRGDMRSELAPCRCRRRVKRERRRRTYTVWRSVRMAEALRDQAQAAADAEGTLLTEFVADAVRAAIRRANARR